MRTLRITVTFVGTVTREQTLDVIDRQAMEGAWAYGVRYDTRLGTNVPSDEDLHQVLLHVGRLTTKYGPRGPVALVVHDPALFTMGSRYAALGDLTALHVRICTSIAEADRWLDAEMAGR